MKICEILKNTPTEDIWSQLTVTRATLNHNISNEITKKENRARQKHYELGNKANKLLAHWLRNDLCFSTEPLV